MHVPPLVAVGKTNRTKGAHGSACMAATLVLVGFTNRDPRLKITPFCPEKIVPVFGIYDPIQSVLKVSFPPVSICSICLIHPLGMFSKMDMSSFVSCTHAFEMLLYFHLCLL